MNTRGDFAYPEDADRYSEFRQARYDRLVGKYRTRRTAEEGPRKIGGVGDVWENPAPPWVVTVVTDLASSLGEEAATYILEWLDAHNIGDGFALVLAATPREIVAKEPQLRVMRRGFLSKKVSYAVRWLRTSGLALPDELLVRSIAQGLTAEGNRR